MEIIPVIHVIDLQQLEINLILCERLNIEKVFLIDHTQSGIDLMHTAIEITSNGIWCGVNILGMSTVNALDLAHDYNVDGLWCDAELPLDHVRADGYKGMFFGALDFKYQPKRYDIEVACENAKRTTDVATTSGPGTGKAASISKITMLKNLLGNHPLAIASGVSVENAKQYADLGVDYALVASSITEPGTEFIQAKSLEKLLEIVKN